MWEPIVIPVLLLVIKALVADEINYWLILIGCYVNRPFDVDRNPKTHDWLMVFNSANGEWECCSLTFHFSLLKHRNGAYLHHYDNNWNLIFTERVPFSVWVSIKKGKITDTTLIEGLKNKIEK